MLAFPLISFYYTCIFESNFKQISFHTVIIFTFIGKIHFIWLIFLRSTWLIDTGGNMLRFQRHINTLSKSQLASDDIKYDNQSIKIVWLCLCFCFCRYNSSATADCLSGLFQITIRNTKPSAGKNCRKAHLGVMYWLTPTNYKCK